LPAANISLFIANELLILLPGITNPIRGFQFPGSYKKLAGKINAMIDEYLSKVHPH
jgi:hypothetical protein